MDAFRNGLRRVLNCSKDQLKHALEYEQENRVGKAKRGPKSSSGRAVRAKH